MGKYSKKIASQQEGLSKVTFSFTEGQYAGGKFFLPLSKLFVIGRDTTSDVAIVETKVSRKHAKLWEQDGHVFIEDLGSTNGTFLNGNRLDSNIPISLRKDDVLLIGDTSFCLNTDLHQLSPTGSDTNPVLGYSAPAPGVTLEEGELVIEEEDDNQDILSSSDAIMNEMLGDTDDELALPTSLLDEDDEQDLLINSSSDTMDDLLSDVVQPELDSLVVGQIGLAKQTAQFVNDNKPLFNINRAGETEGNLSDFTINELLEFLTQSSSAGILKVTVVTPFMETMRIDIASNGIAAASSLSHQKFDDEKSLTRSLLISDADWSFTTSIEAQAYKSNKYLDDILMEISGSPNTLVRYRNLIAAEQLKFVIPITGKLSDLSPSDLETIQMMVNAREICGYLNLFPELDDFVLLNEVVKYVDLGILFGDNNGEE